MKTKQKNAEKSQAELQLSLFNNAEVSIQEKQSVECSMQAVVVDLKNYKSRQQIEDYYEEVRRLTAHLDYL